MNILILEDNKERVKAFREKLIGHSVNITDNAKIAIQQLATNRYDLLFLDHDLGGQEMVPSGEGTGYEVAKFLFKNPRYKPTQIVIHSLNVVGAHNMKKLLPEADYIPGVWLQDFTLKGVSDETNSNV